MIQFFYDSYIIFLQALVPGILLGVIYDLFRILRIQEIAKQSDISSIYQKIMPPKIFTCKRRPPCFMIKICHLAKRTTVFAQDIAFWLIATTIEILFIFQSNNGEIRIYELFLSLLGFLFYHNSLGILVMYFAKHIFWIIHLICSWGIFGISYPIIKTIQLFCRFILFIYKKTVHRWIKHAYQKKLYRWSEKKKRELLNYAHNGFCAKS